MTDPITRVNDLRQKVIRGEEITKEEAAEAIQLLRADRASKVEKASGKASKVPANLGDLFSGA